MLDPRRLRLLVEFQRGGTVASAAAALSYTPSAVSQQLATLQREAGVQLFEHVGRRMSLTDSGRMLAAHGRRVLGAIEEAEAELARTAGEVTGVVRVAAFPTIGMTLLPAALVTLRNRHPTLTVEYREAEPEEALPQLGAGEIDITVAYHEGPQPRDPFYDELILCRDPYLVALPQDHPLTKRRAVPLARLAGAHWVSARPDSAYDLMFTRECREVGGFDPDIRHRSEQATVVAGLVANGAVAIVPSLGWPTDQDESVARRPLAGHRLERQILAVTRATSTQRPSIQAVRDGLRKAAVELHRQS